jgi:hypothetical protein
MFFLEAAEYHGGVMVTSGKAHNYRFEISNCIRFSARKKICPHHLSHWIFGVISTTFFYRPFFTFHIPTQKPTAANMFVKVTWQFRWGDLRQRTPGCEANVVGLESGH